MPDETEQSEPTTDGNLRPGRPLPQGSTWDGDGVNFSLFSENAERVELCLFDDDGNERRIDVRDRTAHLWHVYVPGAGPRQRYGYRVHGPFDPASGARFNAAKLLIDPYAKSIDGPVDWRAANALPYQPSGDEDADLTIDDSDDAAAIPRSVVVDPSFDWEGDRLLGHRWTSTVIYETHVKGFTMRHPEVPETLRGTYAGLACEPAVRYLRELGVTAVELLPVHHIADESFLIDEANLEDNRDGADDNRSWNCGAEGPTDDPDINALRARQQRNFLTTLLLSQGVPMLLGGDELGRTQQGNNNAWCQDAELSWFDWSAVDEDLRAFTAQLIGLRLQEPTGRRSPITIATATRSRVRRLSCCSTRIMR